MAGTRTTIDEICFQLSQCLTDVETAVVGSQTATTALRLRKIVDRRCESALKAPDNEADLRRHLLPSSFGDDVSASLQVSPSELRVAVNSLTDVCPEVIASGVAVYLGGADSRGAAVVFIRCRHPLWQSRDFDAKDVAMVVLYYSLIASDVTVRRKGLTLIADVRGTNSCVLGALMDTLRHVEARAPGAVNIVHVVADREAMQTLLLRAPAFGQRYENLTMQFDLLTNVDALYRFIDRCRLPTELGGDLVCRHGAWLYFRQCLEQFHNCCRYAAHSLMRAARAFVTSLSSAVSLRTVAEARQAVEQHSERLNCLKTDPDIQTLRLDDSGHETRLDVIAEAGARLSDRADVWR